ncbi:hypothetical protein AB6U14_06355 [Klebsiella pneumoniae]
MGNVKGERYSPTQPYSVGMPMIGNQTLTESDMWGATPIDLLLCRIQFKEMRHQGVFTPPGEDRSLQFPGSLGGMNWGSVSLDPNNSLMFVNDMRLGLANYMVPRAKVAKDASGIEMGIVPMEGTPFGAMRERFLSPLGIPCQKPPFGTMSAVDLKTGKLVWQVLDWHRRRHRAAGHTYAHANSNRHADPWRIAGNAVRTAVLRLHPGFLPARL